MTRTLEDRVTALESGELARLRVVAQRRLEKLRQERAAVADLRRRLELAHAKADAFSRRLASIAEDHADELALLRVTVQAAPDATASEVVADAIDHIKQLRELIDDEREESAKEIGRLRDELSDTRSHLKDALEELAEARAELAKAKAPPVDDRLGWFNR